MKRELSFIILASLLLQHGPAIAQDGELSNQDIEKMLNETADKLPEETSAPSMDMSDVEDLESDSSTTETTTTEVQPTETPVSETPTGDTVDVTSENNGTVPAVTEEPSNLDIDKLETDSATEPVTETASSADHDELENLKKDIGDEGEFVPATTVDAEKTKEAGEEPKKQDKKKEVVEIKKEDQPAVFDVGREERDLLAMAQNIQGQISDDEWNELALAAKQSSYTVVKDDWLFKISKKIFGSGFFYPKIWSLNSYITNPHLIEPGMVLAFTTGTDTNAPQMKIGAFSDDELKAIPGSAGNTNAEDLSNFGDDAKPKWLDEKKDLAQQGIYFQYASEETMEDLNQLGSQSLNREYENYEPPRSDFDVVIPKNYDETGFDKNSRIFYSFKEGFYLSTFVSTNIVQDFGKITNGPDENIWFSNLDHAYIEFDESINAMAGDKFSVYSALGKVNNPNSDREGYKYAIVGHIKLIRKIKNKWEVEFFEVSGTPQRGDRITTYTPKIERITRTYNSRLVEAAILSSFLPRQTILGSGDVIYVDRGRADGVEMGNVFEVYGFKDRSTKENITDQPTYKMGELTVITLTDNFATAIVSKTIKDFKVGDIAMTKTKESYLKETRAKDSMKKTSKEVMGGKMLDELDVDLNLENLNDDLLKQADKIQLTEDELAELERQEREKSVIKESEKDLKALERLEGEIEQAESILKDAKLDEDKLLENQSLDEIEKTQNQNTEESVDEIEDNLGKRYIDEDLNSKENPYGLNEFDIEEIDELLNVEKNEGGK